MKRILIMLGVLVFSWCAYAIEDAHFSIQLSAGSRTSVVTLTQGPFYTGEKNPSDMVANLSNTTTAVNIYAIYAGMTNGEMSVMTTNDLNLTYIGFTTNANTSYRLDFDNVSGEAMYLCDHEQNDKLTLITQGGSYEFTATASTRNDTRFQIIRCYQVKTNTSGYASYSNALDLVFAAGQTGVAAYSAVYDEANSELTLTAEAGVNANTGVIIYGAPSTTYTLVPGDVTDYESGLTASVTETTVDATKTNYCLATLNGNCAFYEYTGTTVPANKAYLEVGGSAAPARIRMRINNATTGLDNVSDEAVLGEKVLVGGQLLIRKGDNYYNMQGQIVK